ncbi:MAG: rRNA (uracil1498-N3)-methyltransferase [Chloroflexota bacterium]|nr:rRNA (uracil1498-N3)-methyltransferase [Chloroflexota bacterium]
MIAGDDARHLARSLRARVGEEIEVVDPAGLMLTLRLDYVSPDRVEGSVVAERPHNPEPVAKIVIGIAHLPAPALELVLSRCTEAGAFAFHIIQAERSIARGAKPERWHSICREAAMLAGRLVIPAVSGPSTLDEVLEQSLSPVMLSRTAPLRLAELDRPPDLTLLVGPEGGWTEKEMARVELKATLGARNLRADTAALVALATALSRRD